MAGTASTSSSTRAGSSTGTEDDGVTVGGTFLADDGAHLVDGGSTTQDAPASMGEEFTYTSNGGWSTIVGTPLGVLDTAPLTEGDPGHCYVTYFSFEVTAQSGDGEMFGVVTYAPEPSYIVDGVVRFRHELYPKIGRNRFGLCDTDTYLSGRFATGLGDATLDTTYFSAEMIYLPEGASFDGIVLGFYEGPRVYYAPLFLDSPPTPPNPRGR